MLKMLVFDMDGTIADLYGVENWLEQLRAEVVDPYIKARPMYNMNELNAILNCFKLKGFIIAVTSWTSKGGSAEYNKAVAEAKIEWLNRYNFPADIINIVDYDTPKHEVTKDFGGYQILIDDNADVCNAWENGNTIDATENIVAQLNDLLTRCCA